MKKLSIRFFAIATLLLWASAVTISATGVYCNYATGHLGDKDFGDAAARILLTLEQKSDNVIRVSIAPNVDNGATKKLDYMYVISAGATPYPAETGADVVDGGVDELSVDLTYATKPETLNFTIQYSNPSWDGRWQVVLDNISWAELCSDAPADTEKPVMVSATLQSVTDMAAVVAVEATDNVKVIKYVVKNGEQLLGEFAAVDGVITITGLADNTEYNFSIFAKDAAGNVSDNSMSVSAKTTLRQSQCYGYCGHFAPNTPKRIQYAIESDGTSVTYTVRGLNDKKLDFLEIQTTKGNYPATISGGVGTYTQTGLTEGEALGIRFLYSTEEFDGNEMTSESISLTDANIIYYKVGDGTPVHFVANENYVAMDGVTATASSVCDKEGHTDNVAANALVADGQWESVWDVDPQWFQVDLGKVCQLNHILLNWGWNYSKRYDILASCDGEDWITLSSIDATLTEPFEQNDRVATTFARYIKLNLKERGAGYGNIIKQIQISYVSDSKLQSISLASASNICKVGENVALSLTAKDQYDAIIDAGEVTYTVSPADAGAVENNVYTAAKVGVATITATVGELTQSVEIMGYDGDNLALSTNIDSDNKVIDQSDKGEKGTDAFYAVDGNDGSAWQGSTTDGTAADEASRTYDSWFILDLGASYNIDLVAIHFEGACSQEYHIDFSANNTDWSLAYNYVGKEGVDHNRYDNIFGDNLANSEKVRYVRFWSTKAATQYGMKILDFQVYGHIDGTTPTNVAETEYPTTVQKTIINGQLVIVRGGHCYNAQGQVIE